MVQSTAAPTGNEDTTAKEKDGRSRAAGISFFCPAYLDEANVGRVVERGIAALAGSGMDFELIIVEDHSPDGTSAAADLLAGRFEAVKVIHNERNIGHGGALKTGFAAAKFEWAGFCDGDDQYDPRDLPKFIDAMRNADVVIGRRTIYPNGRFRSFVSKSMNLLIRHLFGAPFNDLGCSFKMFRASALDICGARSGGIFVQCEMVLRAYAAGLRVVEVPVGAYPRTGGRSSALTLRNALVLLRDMLSLWNEINFGKRCDK